MKNGIRGILDLSVPFLININTRENIRARSIPNQKNVRNILYSSINPSARSTKISPNPKDFLIRESTRRGRVIARTAIICKEEIFRKSIEKNDIPKRVCTRY